MTEQKTRVPPQDDGAECSVLGALFLDMASFDRVAGIVTADDFYKESHRVIFEVASKVAAVGAQPDMVTVLASLKECGKVDLAGGPEYVAAISEAALTISNVEHYAKIVAEKAALRRYIVTQHEFLEEAYTGVPDVPEFFDRAETATLGSRSAAASKPARSARDILRQNFAALQERSKNKGKLQGLATGFADLDKIVQGMQGGDLVILAARPSMGKTALALNIATNAALDGTATLVLSLEMSDAQLLDRAVASQARIRGESIRNAYMSDENWQDLYRVSEQIGEAPLYVNDTGAITINDARAQARRCRHDHGLGLLAIDYLQLMRGSGKKDGREQEVSEISRGLKALAKELNIPVLALSQLNRDLEKRSNKRPILSDLRESGSLEQDADVVLFIYRDEVYNEKTPDAGIAEVIIAKHRNGAIGTTKLKWTGEYTRFDNLAKAGGW